MTEVILKPGHVRPLWAGHPWVFAQGIAKVIGPAAAGSEVRVLDAEGHVLGRGLYSPKSAIPVRLYTQHGDKPLDLELLTERLERALARRRLFELPNSDTNALRVVNGEGDGLPGLIVDRFGDVVTLQFLTAGMKLREPLVLEAVQAVLAPRAVVDRTPAASAEREGFRAEGGVIAGDTQLAAMQFEERGLRFEIPLSLAQKTGFYLDLRALRQKLARLAKGRRVLDCYAYVGAAGMHMARGGAAQVKAVESSEAALLTGRRCIELNQLGAVMSIERADAHQALAAAAAEGGYDLVLCDPPKLAPTRAAAKRAEKAMQMLAKAAAAATRPGGILVLCSCSAGLGLQALGRALAVGASMAQRRATVLDRVFQDVDHPTPAAFPEGLYLSSVIAEIDLHG